MSRLTAPIVLSCALLTSTVLAQGTPLGRREHPVQLDHPSWIHSNRQVSKLPRKSAKQVLGAEGIATSLTVLRSILEPGHQVVFAQRDASRLASVFATGGLWSGRAVLIAEIAADRLVLVRKRLFHTEELVVPADSIRRIDIVDSTRNGYLLGAAIGGALGLAEVLETNRYARSRGDCNMCPLGYGFGILLPFVGGGVGALIDSTINEAVYEQGSPRRRVTVAPVLDRERIAFMGRVRF